MWTASMSTFRAVVVLMALYLVVGWLSWTPDPFMVDLLVVLVVAALLAIGPVRRHGIAWIRTGRRRPLSARQDVT